MTERRASARFELASPSDVHVRVRQDVRVMQSDRHHVTVLSPTPAIRGESVDVYGASSRDTDQPSCATISGSAPCAVSNHVMHIVRIEFPRSSRLGGRESALTAESVFVQLARTHVARMLNLSRGGCLLELRSLLGAGTVAELMDDQRPSESIRIAHVRQRRLKDFPYVVGGAFLPLPSPGPWSLRDAATRLEMMVGGPSPC